MVAQELDLTSGIPMYRQIKDILRAEIVDGAADADNPMTEAQLLERFDVSRAPIRQALKELTLEGYVYRRQGRGTFPVAGARIERPVDTRPGDLHRYLLERGLEPRSSVAGLTYAVPPVEVGQRLSAQPGERLLRFTRLITVEGKPFASNLLYFRVPDEFSPTRTDLDDGGSMLAILDRRYGLVVERSEHDARAIAANAEQAASLDVRLGSPLLAVETVFFATGGLPIGWRQAVHRAEEFAFRFVTTP
ncbi:GntR family transcriptional regulator [Microbacterium sp. A204]|uniref:GntR family transcriptional regulator n=1 Tax=Microbacterium sp. A204 TaxID=3457321 RepID=UPI003FD4189E